MITYASKICQNRPKYSSHTFPTSSRFAASWVVASPGNSSQTRLFKACISPGSFVQGFRCLKIIANNSLLASLVSTRFYIQRWKFIHLNQAKPPRQHPSSPPDSHFAHSRVSNPSLFCRNSSWLLRVTAYLGGKLQWKTSAKCKAWESWGQLSEPSRFVTFSAATFTNFSKFLLQYCTYLTTSYLTRVHKYIHMVHMTWFTCRISTGLHARNILGVYMCLPSNSWRESATKNNTTVSTYQDLSANAVAVFGSAKVLGKLRLSPGSQSTLPPFPWVPVHRATVRLKKWCSGKDGTE